MYAPFYNLIEEPFPVTPDPKYLFLSDSHKEALATIVYGIDNRRGFIAIVGEVGTGKTTILRAYLDAIEKSDFTVIYVFNPEMTFKELVLLLASELGVPPPLDKFSNTMLISAVQRALIREYNENRTVILVIDEAQNIPVSTLESLRMLSNIETKKAKLLQVVLAGQPELEQLIGRHELRQLKQRIAVKATIKPLSDKDSRRYIEERIKAVSLDKRVIFRDAALTKIIKFAGGIPRSINIACDTALINGYGHGARRITKNIANEAIESLQGPAKSPSSYWRLGALTMVLLAALVAWAMMFRDWPITRAGDQPSVEQVGRESGDVEILELPPEIVSIGPTAAPAGPPDIDTDTTGDPGQQVDDAPGVTNVALPAGRAEPEIPPSSTRDIADEGVSSGLGASDIANETLAQAEPLVRVEPNPGVLYDQDSVIVYTIEDGDLLSELCFDFYGFTSPELYQFLQANNPRLADINDISVGETLRFPDLTDDLQSIRNIEIRRRLGNPAPWTGVTRPQEVVE